MKQKKSNALTANEKKSRLSNIKGMISRDEQRKVLGGYTVCSGYQRPCYACQYAGQFVSPCWW
jgi:hypothetical protein